MTPDDRILAAEVALELLDGTERDAALARLADDAVFAVEVAWWRTQLAGLTAEYGTAIPSDVLAARIAAAVERSGSGAQPARHWPWFVGGAALGALAASLSAFVLLPSTIPPSIGPAARGPLLAAAVTPAAGVGGSALPIVVDAGARAIRIAVPPAVPARRAAELWRIGADGVPRSLGILQATGTTKLRITVSLHAGDTLAISIEPPGGSPSGAPTGPVVATGKLVSA